jgi:LacI family transcriptional regulator
MQMGMAYSKPGKGVYVADPSSEGTERQLVLSLCGVKADYLSATRHDGWVEGLLRAQHRVSFLLEPVAPTEFASMIDRFRRGVERTDGAIVMGVAMREELIAAMVKAGFPHVVIDVPEVRDDINAVICDHEEGAFQVVSHLVRRGYSRVAFIGQTPGAGEGNAWANAKHAGYMRALRLAGIRVHAEDVMFIDHYARHHSSAYAEQAIREVLRPGESEVTAVFASIESVAVEVLKQLSELGVDVPGEMAVAGFNDREALPVNERRYTTLRIPMEEAAEEGVQMLVAQLRGQEPSPQQRVLTGRLIVRQSTVRNLF